MDKNYLQDVVPPSQKRSIRDIPIPTRGRSNPDIKIKKEEDTEEINNHSVPPIHREEDAFEDYDDEPKKGKFKKYGILAGILIFLFVLFSIISSFDSAVLTIKPKYENSSYSEQILIEELSKRQSNESLGYRIIELSQESLVNVKAVDEEPVQEKASGEITIFNEYSKNPQRLIRNTRFESEDGRIYRITDSIEVPGYTGEEDNVTPGEITVTVFADEVGNNFNLESGSFTIPGFKDQEPYDFFSAKTKTSIVGGFDGIRKVVSNEDIEQAKINLEEEVRSKLLNELNAQVTDEFLIQYTDDSFVFEQVTQNDIDDSDDVELKMRGKVSAKIFNKIDLSNSLAENLFANYFTNENTKISNFGTINLEITQSESTDNEFITVSGDSEFVWQINEVELRKDLINIEKSSLSTIMQDYTEIQKAEAVIKPFWRSTFPEKEKDIEIEIEK